MGLTGGVQVSALVVFRLACLEAGGSGTTIPVGFTAGGFSHNAENCEYQGEPPRDDETEQGSTGSGQHKQTRRWAASAQLTQAASSGGFSAIRAGLSLP